MRKTRRSGENPDIGASRGKCTVKDERNSEELAVGGGSAAMFHEATRKKLR